MKEEPVGDRRPIASRNLVIWQRAAQWLTKAGVSANAISVAGMVCGVAAGAGLACTGCGTGICPTITTARVLFFLAAAMIQLRLLANMLDGMVAIAAGKASSVGELFNEIPDRISDTAILAGAGYAAASNPALGWAAAAVALFVTYIRALGKGMGVPGLFQGPMSKSHRMFLMTVACVYMGAAPVSWWPALQVGGRVVGPMAMALAIVIAGGILTAYRRTLRIVSAVRARG